MKRRYAALFGAVVLTAIVVNFAFVKFDTKAENMLNTSPNSVNNTTFIGINKYNRSIESIIQHLDDIAYGTPTPSSQNHESEKDENIYLGEKIDILVSGDPQENIDIMFILDDLDDTAHIGEIIEKLFHNEKSATESAGLFKREPFASYVSKFNIAYINRMIDRDDFEISFETLLEGSIPKRLTYSFNKEKLIEEYTVFNPDYIIVLYNSTYTSSGGEIQYLNLNDPKYVWTFVHEFGHQFGGLVDAYVFTLSPSFHCGNYDSGFVCAEGELCIDTSLSENCFDNYEEVLSYYPNVDTLGCPRWCEEFDLTILLKENEICSAINTEKECASLNGGGICTWFKTKHPFLDSNCVRVQGFNNIGVNCVDGAGCFFGGDYGQLAFSSGGLMSGGLEFSYPSKKTCH